jgi:reductive dehalogenase
MSKFHSTVTRRDFMKALGLAGAGIGAAAASAPVFHDLDEFISSPEHPKRAWWVKEVDEPTMEVDWQTLQRFDHGGKSYLMNPVPLIPILKDKIKQYVLNNTPGHTLRDHALLYGSSYGVFGWGSGFGSSFVTQPKWAYEYNTPLMEDGSVAPWSYQMSFTPKTLGVPSWEGTPEENLKLCRSAVAYYGGGDAGATELNTNTKKLIYAYDSGGKAMEFENVDEAYETDTKKVIPNKCNSVLSWNVLQSNGMLKVGTRDDVRGPVNCLTDSTTYMAYCHNPLIAYRLQKFFSTLGYQALGTNPGAIVAMANYAGLGETGRHMMEISPEHGSLVRMPPMLITDMPLAPSKPIDAGMRRFCFDCGKCASWCPSGAIPEGEPTWEVSGIWNQGGVKTWYNDRAKCQPIGWGYETDGMCCNCLSECPFSTLNQASIHDFVKATIATTSLLNGFFFNMDKVFDYGHTIHPDDWWDRDLSTWRYSGTYGR